MPRFPVLVAAADDAALFAKCERAEEGQARQALAQTVHDLISSSRTASMQPAQ